MTAWESIPRLVRLAIWLVSIGVILMEAVGLLYLVSLAL